MPIKVTCPKCQGVLHAPDDAGGKRGKCPTCGTVLAIPADSPRVTAPPAGPSPAESAAGHTPYKFSDEPARGGDPAAESRRSSLGGLNRPPDADPRHGSSGRLPPPSFGGPEPRRASGPLASSGKLGGSPAAAADDDLVRGWRRTRRGLWWVRLALVLFLIPILGLAGIAIAENYGTRLPAENPGFLKVNGLSSDHEIRAAVGLVPAALGLLALALGRFIASGAPRSSHAKGLLTAASLATLLTVAGVIAYAVPTGGQLAAGRFPENLLPKDELNGALQRSGLAIAGILWPLAEVWFAVALGRMGVGLGNDRLSARGTRFLIYVGLLTAAGVLGWYGWSTYPTEVTRYADEYVLPQWNNLGEHRRAVAAGLWAAGGLIVWSWFARLVGSARRATREWLERSGAVV